MIELKKAEPQDCGAIHAMQVEAFAELLEKYRSEEHTSELQSPWN